MALSDLNRSMPPNYVLDTQKTFAVTDASNKALNDGSRSHCVVQNQGANIVWVRFGSAAVADATSYALYPGNDYPFGNALPNEAIYVICAAGKASTLHVAEG